MVIDTDTFNEIDDQFALVWALSSPEKVSVEAIYAAPFFNHLSSGPKDGMDKSYNEILRILSLLNIPSEGYVFKGSEGYLEDCQTPRHSEAAYDLVERAMHSGADPLYVVALGAITNVASALLIEPRIIENIVVIWLGGHAHHWPNAKEFNLQQDIPAARILFDSGVPLVQIPCAGVASHMSTTLSEMRDYVKGQGAIGDYLYGIFQNCHNDHVGYSRVIWDMTPIAYLINSGWISTSLVHSPILTDQITLSHDTSRHFIRYATSVNRDAIFRDFFLKIKQATDTTPPHGRN